MKINITFHFGLYNSSSLAGLPRRSIFHNVLSSESHEDQDLIQAQVYNIYNAPWSFQALLILIVNINSDWKLNYIL